MKKVFWIGLFLTFLAIPIGYSFQLDVCEISSWDEIYGAIFQTQEAGCTVEVEDWEDPCYIGIDTEPLLTARTTGSKMIKFSVDLTDLDIQQDGRFYPLSWVGSDGQLILMVAFGWVYAPQTGIETMRIRGKFYPSPSLTGETDFLEFGQYLSHQGLNHYDIEIIFSPSYNDPTAGWVSLVVNGQLAGTLYQIDMDINDARAEGVIRFGSTIQPLQPNLGGVQINPVQPTPINRQL